ncbi:hypothetical protein IQ06DRAFT_368552 [Phaeosphaeriaceae sp. SRC1lsM3a]|nr:hypothetical protein IQ06DRAFT_368552 [Stagonospora sp. SRC1lsM3a]
MGYTHYWRVRDTTKWNEVWPAFIEDAQRIIAATEIELIADGDNTNVQPPIVNAESGISLNGEADPCESFIVRPDQSDRGFCKTARRPYDVVVTAILLRAAQLAGDAFSVGSDGFWDEWKAGRELVLSLWPDDEQRRAAGG